MRHIGRIPLLVAALAWATPLPAQERTIVFEVLLPTNATLEIQGYKTTSTGESRLYETPALAVGKTYEYTLNATLGDKKVTKKITLKTEGRQVFDLRPDFAAKAQGTTGTEKAPKPGRTAGPKKEGFATYIEDGRLWVFREGSKELATYRKGEELEKHIIRVGAGPKGMTVKGPDAETVIEYLLGQDGFVAILDKSGERVWVFRKGSKELDAFKKDGDLARHVIRVGAGPLGMTIKGPDAETIDAYMRAYDGK